MRAAVRTPREQAAAPAVHSPRSLTRVFALLDAIARASDGLTLSELSVALDAPKSSLLVLLRPLVAMDYLDRVAARYTLGSSAFRIASEILSARSFPRLVRGYMQELAARTRETVFLAALDADARTVTYVECIESPQAVRYVVPAGTTRALYASAAGRVLLAFQDDAWREHYLRSERLDRLTSRTVTDRDALRRELQVIRSEGIAVALGEAVEGAAGIAAPLAAADGTVRYALLVGAPVERFQRELPSLRQAMLDVIARASGATREAGG